MLAGLPEIAPFVTFHLLACTGLTTHLNKCPVLTLIVLLGWRSALDLDFLDIQWVINGVVTPFPWTWSKKYQCGFLWSLHAAYVIADSKNVKTWFVSKSKPSKQGTRCASPNWREGLLNEVLDGRISNCLYGKFDTKYLDVPEEVLVTSMETHQRYFVVHDLDGQLRNKLHIWSRNGNAKGTWKMLSEMKSLGGVLKMVNSSGVRDQNSDEVSLLNWKPCDLPWKNWFSLERTWRVVSASLAERQVWQLKKRQPPLISWNLQGDLLTGMVGEFDELQGNRGEKIRSSRWWRECSSSRQHQWHLPDSAIGPFEA